MVIKIFSCIIFFDLVNEKENLILDLENPGDEGEQDSEFSNFKLFHAKHKFYIILIYSSSSRSIFKKLQ